MKHQVRSRKYEVSLLALLVFPLLGLAGELATNAPAERAVVPQEPVIKVGDELVVMDEGPGKNLRCLPAVAAGSNGYLVVWQEGWHGDGGNSRIFAARVSAEGEVLDGKRVEIAASKTGVQERPKVAFLKDTYLVVWQDMRNGKDCDVLGARVSAEGKVLDLQPIQIAVGPRSQTLPDVAADDKGFMVVWQGFAGTENVVKTFAASVGLDGEAGSPVVVAATGGMPKIAWNGKEHLVIFWFYCEQSHLKSVRLDTSGKTLSEPQRIAVPWGALCGIPGKGWVVAGARSKPDNWGWGGPGAQRVYSVTADGKLADDTPSENYNELKAVPLNWMDTSMNRTDKLWPWGGTAVAPVSKSGKTCLVVYQRYHRGGTSGQELLDGDIMARVVDGWKPLGNDNVPVAASDAGEENPALASGGGGRFLCVYEKAVEDRTVICGRVLVSP